MTIKHNYNQTVINTEREREIYATLKKMPPDGPQYINLLNELRELRIYHGETVMAYFYNLPIFQEKIVPAQIAHIDERLAIEPGATSSDLIPELVDIAKIIIKNEMGR